jgi:hypothetical protein
MVRTPGRGGARTPEDLEALFEDALVMRSVTMLGELFDDHAVLVTREAGTARGVTDVVALALAALRDGNLYTADPRLVTQTRDIALIIGACGTNVACRGRDGVWRFTIVLQEIDPGEKRSAP